MLNKTVLIGRLTDDPDLRYTSSGTAVANFTLAVERNYKNKDGDRETDFIDIVAWRNLGKTCANHLGKGRMVAVSGRLQIRKSEKDGRTYINPEVVANDITFLDWPDDDGGQIKQDNQEAQEQPPAKDEPAKRKDRSRANTGAEKADDFDVPF